MSIPKSVTATDAVLLGFDDVTTDEVYALNVEKRYGEERAKRLRDDGEEQFIDISLSDKFRYFQEDPWADPAAVKDAQSLFPDNCCQLLILGAGFGGILYAVRMIQAGIKPENIRIVDSAAGFGGTWYHNRYPGLACDIESYCYLPLLEETGYIPKHRYSSGEEIRQYADLIAQKWKIADSAVFLTKAEKLEWDESTKEWKVELVQKGKGKQPQTLNVRSQFVATVNGVLNWPKLPGIPGIPDFKGDIFHSSRWNYSVTGGSPGNPILSNLKDKRVAVIGTGASSVQFIPHLARASKKLYIVQRTPASVDRRDQSETDIEDFKRNVATSPGWQRERMRNFHQHFTTEKQPDVNLVNDQWTHAVGMAAITGNASGPKTMEELPAYMKLLNALDLPRQNQIRARVEREVTDPTTAKLLQAWYPTWCKRPCFSDEYLPTFNRDNVTLIDTNGKGLDRITADSIIVGEQSYPVDIIIFATGYRAPFGGTPADKANLTITGREGISMTDEWARNGPSTLHGVLDHNFPNLFLAGPWQASGSGNYLFNDDAMGKHSAYILTEAQKRAGGKPFVVSSTAAAAADWALQIMMRSVPMAAIIGCTPSFFNLEGAIDRTPPEEQMKMARSGVWGNGIEDFLTHIEAWRAEGNLQGVEIEV